MSRSEHASLNRWRFGWKVLVFLMFLQGIGAIFGGGALVLDPSGQLIFMDVEMLQQSPFADFLIPGMILLVVLGVAPILIGVALIRRWNWRLAERLNLLPDQHWSWSFSLYTGFALIIWIVVQVYILQAVAVIHLLYIGIGLAIQITALLPSVQKHYSKS